MNPKNDALVNFLLLADSERIRRLHNTAATGGKGRRARWPHCEIPSAEVAEATRLEAQHVNAFRLIILARQFRSEGIDTAISLDPHDIRAHRDLLE